MQVIFHLELGEGATIMIRMFGSSANVSIINVLIYEGVTLDTVGGTYCILGHAFVSKKIDYANVSEIQLHRFSKSLQRFIRTHFAGQCNRKQYGR